jgi:hypothetical protein
MFQNVVTLTGATQFGAATAVATFLEQINILTASPTIAPRILGYSYNSLGAAATVTLRLSPTVASAVNLQVDLETPTAAVNSFTNVCGKGGVVVPRQFGLTNDGLADQTLDVALGLPNSALPLVLLFTTVGKDNTATFRVWWDYVEIGGAN